MGLSAVSLRRSAARPPKSRPRPALFRLCASRSAVAPANLRRARDLPALDLLHHLSQLAAPAAPDELNDLIRHIAANRALLQNVVAAALSPPVHCVDAPRERLPRAWVLSVLLRHGPAPLRDALADEPSLIVAFADVFRAPPTKLDAALAAHAADVLRALLQQFPKQTASALHRTQLVARLVQHVSLQPAADLLPRFVGTRIFTSGFSPVLPMHKRAIVMMASARVHHLLLARFEHAVQVLLAQKQGSREYAAASVEGVCNAMAAISMRAMCIPRKHEDSDERTDVQYSVGLGLISASVYNDAKDYLNLLRSVQPLRQLLQLALRADARQLPEVLFPTMTLLCSLLRAIRKKNKSLFPSMRKAVAEVDTSRIAGVLCDTVRTFEHMLHADNALIVGRARLAVVDLLREACCTINEHSLCALLRAHDYALVRRLLALTRAFSRNEMVLTRVAQAFGAVLSRAPQLGDELLQRIPELFELLLRARSCAPLWTLLRSFVCSASFERAMRRSEHHDGARHDALLELEELYDEHVRAAEETGLQKVSELKQSKLRGDTEIDVDALYGQSEDYGQEVYIRALLQEVSGANDSTPPSDNVVQHAAEAVHHAAEAFTERFNRALLQHHE